MNEMGVSDSDVRSGRDHPQGPGLELPPVSAVTNPSWQMPLCNWSTTVSFSWRAVVSLRYGAPWRRQQARLPQPLAGVGEAFKKERLLGN